MRRFAKSWKPRHYHWLRKRLIRACNNSILVVESIEKRDTFSAPIVIQRQRSHHNNLGPHAELIDYDLHRSAHPICFEKSPHTPNLDMMCKNDIIECKTCVRYIKYSAISYACDIIRLGGYEFQTPEHVHAANADAKLFNG